MKLFRFIMSGLLALCLIMMPVMSSANAGSTTVPTPTKTLPTGFKFPPISEIAKRLASRANVVNYAVESLLGAVDWVLDPKNNRVIYHPRTETIEEYTGEHLYTIHRNYLTTSRILALNKGFLTKQETCTRENILSIHPELSPYITYIRIENDYCVFFKEGFEKPIETIHNPNYDESKQQSIKYEQVAEQIIKNAKADHAESVDFVLMTNREIALAKAKSSPQCDEEWEKAHEICEELIKKGGYRGLTGNYQDISKCAKGFVTEECGGNKIEW